MHRTWFVEIDDAQNVVVISSVTLRGRFGNGNRVFYPGQQVVLTRDIVALSLSKGDRVVIQSLNYPGGGRGFIMIGPTSSGQLVAISHDDVTEAPQTSPTSVGDVPPHDCASVEEPEPKGYGLV